MSDHKVSKALYGRFERTLDIFKDEGHEPWYEFYFHIVERLCRDEEQYHRRIYVPQRLEWGQNHLKQVSKGLPIDWGSYQIIDEQEAYRLFRVFGYTDLTDEDIDPYAICFSVLNKTKKKVFTPPRLARLAVESLGLWRDDRVLDLASGTGVFLREASRHFETRVRDFNRHSLWGIERDPILCALSRALRIIKFYEIIGESEPQEKILYGDALDINNPDLTDGSFDKVFCNPPYAVSVDDKIAQDYELASTPVGSRSEVLFIERAIGLTRPRIGKIALILPEEVFENPKYAEVHDFIKRHTQLVGEYYLPPSMFALSGFDMKTRLLILQKTTKKLKSRPFSIELDSLSRTRYGRYSNRTVERVTSKALETNYIIPRILGSLVLKKEYKGDMSWKRLSNILEDLRDTRAALPPIKEVHKDDHTGKQLHWVTDGAIRDLVMDFLDLRIFDGLDGNVLEIFSDIRAKEIEDAREEAYQIALERTMQQVKRGNTFFLDPNKMSERPELGPLVAKILDVRNKQIILLEDNPPLADVYSTYYGFTVLIMGSVQEGTTGITSESIDTFSELASNIGRDLSLDNRQLKYSKKAFGRVTDYTRHLLWNMLQVSAAGENNRRKAIKELGALRDSRAIPLLHLKLQSAKEHPTRTWLLDALAINLHPSTKELFNDLIVPDHRHRRKVREILNRLERRVQ